MCYLFRLKPLPHSAFKLFNITRPPCHEKSSSNRYLFVLSVLATLVLAVALEAQEAAPPAPAPATTQPAPVPATAKPSAAPPPSAQPTPAPATAKSAASSTFTTRPALPAPQTLVLGEWQTSSLEQEKNGSLYIFRGHAEMEDRSILVRGDYIEYDEETKVLIARGNVYFHGFEQNEQLWCDHLEYNREDQKGKFYDVRGESMPKVVVRRGVLSGNSPFHFEGEWAERVGEKYILYDGWITNCKMPNPWWKLRGPKFDIIPGDRAKGYKSWFILRRFPVFFTPYFYHSLEKEPRHTGFLIPKFW